MIIWFPLTHCALWGPLISVLLESPHFAVADAAVQGLEGFGATAGATPCEVAEQSDVVITMLPSNPHVREVYCGSDGILKGVRPGSILIDSSTIDPNVAREVAVAVEKAGAAMIDAPVSGGVGGADAGTLTFMVGGAESHLDAARPILEDMGQNVVHCGDIGTGQVGLASGGRRGRQGR